MTQPPNKPNHSPRSDRSNQISSSSNSQSRSRQQDVTGDRQRNEDIATNMVKKIDELTGLKAYPIRELVNHAQEFGPYLKHQRLETNQIRKFLDAVNQLKAKFAQDEGDEIEKAESKEDKNKLRFAKIEDEIVLLKPKLAYAAARQKAAKPMSQVMSVAIDKVHSAEDFERLVQLIESIIAYHKAEGGK
jgi:CRISPR-associated protein Csm2